MGSTYVVALLCAVVLPGIAACARFAPAYSECPKPRVDAAWDGAVTLPPFVATDAALESRFRSVLTVPSGWRRAEIASLQHPDGALTVGTCYRRGLTAIYIEVIDAKTDTELVDRLRDARVFREDASGHVKGLKYRSYSGVETWEQDEGLGSVSLLVGSRVVVRASGRLMSDTKALRALLEALDLGPLEVVT